MWRAELVLKELPLTIVNSFSIFTFYFIFKRVHALEFQILLVKISNKFLQTCFDMIKLLGKILRKVSKFDLG